MAIYREYKVSAVDEESLSGEKSEVRRAISRVRAEPDKHSPSKALTLYSIYPLFYSKYIELLKNRKNKISKCLFCHIYIYI